MFERENSKRSYYDILKIDPASSDAAIRQAYLRLAQIYHPDKNPGNKKIAALRFRLINEAYAALKNQENRERYNRLLLMKQGKPAGFRLKAENDNKPAANNNNIWNSLVDFFVPSKSENLKDISSREKT